MITPYTGSSWENATGRLSADQLLCLPSPVRINDDSTLSIDDLISPFTIPVPVAHRETVLATLEAMYEEPLIRVDRLTRVYLSSNAKVFEALLWMIDTGLLLKTSSLDSEIPLQAIGTKMSTPLLAIQRANPFADALIFG